jgi:hypothetical protein
MNQVKSNIGIMVDTRLVRFIGGMMIWNESEQNECYTIYLNDIDETFWFDDKANIQEFVNIQERERFGSISLRKGSFNYMNENKENTTYKIWEIDKKGKIIAFDSFQ